MNGTISALTPRQKKQLLANRVDALTAAARSQKSRDAQWNALIDSANEKLQPINEELMDEAISEYGKRVGPRDDLPKESVRASAHKNPFEFGKALTAAARGPRPINKLSEAQRQVWRKRFREGITKGGQRRFEFELAFTALRSISLGLGKGVDFFNKNIISFGDDALSEEIWIWHALERATEIHELLDEDKLAGLKINGRSVLTKAIMRTYGISEEEAIRKIDLRDITARPAYLSRLYEKRITKTGISTQTNNAVKRIIDALKDERSTVEPFEELSEVLFREANKNPEFLYRFNRAVPRDQLKRIVDETVDLYGDMVEDVLEHIDQYLLEGMDYIPAKRRALQQVPLEKDIIPGDFKTARRRRDWLKAHPGASEAYAPWLHTISERLNTNVANNALLELARAEGAEYKVWRTQGDSRVRSSHVAVNNTAVLLEGDFIVGGKAMARPGDSRGWPVEVVNCRCYVLPGRKNEDGEVITAPNRVFSNILKDLKT